MLCVGPAVWLTMLSLLCCASAVLPLKVGSRFRLLAASFMSGRGPWSFDTQRWRVFGSAAEEAKWRN
jgi:hypothetical protein